MMIGANQTLFDIAIRDFGTIEAAFAMAAENDVPVTSVDIRDVRTELRPMSRHVVSYYSANGINPATDSDIRYAKRTSLSWINEAGWDNKSIW